MLIPGLKFRRWTVKVNFKRNQQKFLAKGFCRYMFTLYYALAFHSTCSSRFKSYKSLSNSRTGNPKILGNQQLLFSLLFQLRGFKDLAPSFRGSTMMSKKIRDSWLSQGWRYIIQGTGNQWVQHCQESWLALVPGLWDFSGGLLWA